MIWKLIIYKFVNQFIWGVREKASVKYGLRGLVILKYEALHSDVTIAGVVYRY